MKNKKKLKLFREADGMIVLGTHKHTSEALWVTMRRQLDSLLLAFQRARNPRHNDRWFDSQTCSIPQHAIRELDRRVDRKSEVHTKCPARTLNENMKLPALLLLNNLPTGLTIDC